MTAHLRSKQGCWTCRLRKKKCDERRPSCSACESLTLTCYGFGTKPEWMHDTEKEKAILTSFKEIVKKTSRGKTTSLTSKPRSVTMNIAPRPTVTAIQETAISDSRHSAEALSISNPTTGDAEGGIRIREDFSGNSLSPKKEGSSASEYDFRVAPDEFVLVMNYLDKVFPLQYPMYQPGVVEGGRGWLLKLLLLNKPFYHAALASSVYHRQVTTPGNVDSLSQVSASLQQARHVESCIELVAQFAHKSCPKSGLGIITAVIQLMFVELCTGDGTAWQTHLRAAINMYHQGREIEGLTKFGFSEQALTITRNNIPLIAYIPLVAEEVAGFRFLTGTIIWLDITSSITAGTAPLHLPSYLNYIASDSHTKLEDITGCKNWVILQIGRIAALNEQRSRRGLLPQGSLQPQGTPQFEENISGGLAFHLTQAALEDFNTSISTTIPIAETRMLVTRTFVSMAIIYLHLVLHGFHKLEPLESTVSKTMRMIQSSEGRAALPALVLPLFMLGSVVELGEEQFFRDVFSLPPLLDPQYKHRSKILPILEEVWARRRGNTAFSWEDALKLTHDIVLI